MRLTFAAALLTSVVFRTADPVQTLPNSYNLQFENEWVKVVRVVYAPHVKLPAHSHTTHPAAFVYLNDSGPVVFRHVGLEYNAVTRPPTKARGFRLNTSVNEEHSVENLSPLPSEFLRVEFKTEPKEKGTFGGRYYSAPDSTGKKGEQVQFENAQVKITRLFLKLRETRQLKPARTPALLIAFGQTHVGAHALNAGDQLWMSPNLSSELKNESGEVTEVLRFDFKTPPLTSKTLLDER